MKKTIIKLLRNLLLENFFFYSNFIKPLKKELNDVTYILELGAGKSTYLRKIKDKTFHITALDINQNSLNIAKNNNVYDDYIQGDVNQLDTIFSPNQFDAVIAFDLIEHLSKNDGFKLINSMSTIAQKKIIIFTPNGFLKQDAFDNNPFQEHISGWDYNEMKDLGFKIDGVNGHKKLRGMYSTPKIKPIILGTFISNLSWLILKFLKLEKKSFAIMCFKNLK